MRLRGIARRAEPEVGAVPVLRIIPVLRSDHVKRNSRLTDGVTLYFAENPDLAGTAIPQSMARTSIVAACRRTFEAKEAVLELPEPLWVRYLPYSLVLSALWKLANLRRRARRPVVAYAIENNDFEQVAFGMRQVPAWFASVVRAGVGVCIWACYSRIAYGGRGAQRGYERLPLVGRIESAVFEPLPSAERIDRVSAERSATDVQVVFVGVVERGRASIC
ncbi:hypothetical protein [Williamsia sp. D3]|uniref:hypothetical protein n=1 Tax=Williamsia sp. D3 TaxID=1313067 RepID=UPI0003D31903|nr:hypothetical protein [Williamsia sp. D3]ETD30637.1 hypothetical protein W823_23540 [Williamsia sp. D3]